MGEDKKTVKPYFNSQYKNDQGYVYIKIGNNFRHKPLNIVPLREEDTFGPFRHKYSINGTLESMRHIFPILPSKDGYDLSYNILPLELDEDSFSNNRYSLLRIFRNGEEMEKLIYSITDLMHNYAKDMQFEIAANLRNLADRLRILNKILYQYEDILKEDIVLKLPVKNGYKLFYVKSGILSSIKKVGKDYDLKEFVKSVNDIEETNIDEKSYIDFRDILLSEISTLPEEDIVYIKPKGNPPFKVLNIIVSLLVSSLNLRSSLASSITPKLHYSFRYPYL